MPCSVQGFVGFRFAVFPGHALHGDQGTFKFDIRICLTLASLNNIQTISKPLCFAGDGSAVYV
jgi:hypothetical protein